MFTGIIHHIGLFRGFRQGKKEIAIEAPSVASKLNVGDSLAINGACLSLIKKQKNLLFFSLSEETIKKTTFGALRQGERLNLELPLTLSSPLGGHFVSGHIDSRVKVQKITKKKTGARITISFPPELKRYLISKGSVALNGVSLTIADLGETSFDVELILITLENSNFGMLKRGDEVNIECDMIGKYVYNWISEEKQERKERY